jgi:hypothetical protein
VRGEASQEARTHLIVPRVQARGGVAPLALPKGQKGGHGGAVGAQRQDLRGAPQGARAQEGALNNHGLGVRQCGGGALGGEAPGHAPICGSVLQIIEKAAQQKARAAIGQHANARVEGVPAPQLRVKPTRRNVGVL